ncbi:hypothetical protein SteCoe_4044 [Stentor coeruleus]|uniref:Uncharacterized protein n=1 Tax=Stentor coeruleus TaxID=5963 RepID=A0A1R2CVR3_9CILI|nr:hypothetical protein SteCoe_4044 [Stentor coeruleus]
MQGDEILWKINQPEKITALLRAYKHLASIDETISIIIHPKKVDFFSESQDNSVALNCTFLSSFFNEFRGSQLKLFGIYSKNLLHATEVHKLSIVSLIARIRNEEYLDLIVEYNSGVVATYGCPFNDKIHEICLSGNFELQLLNCWIADNYVFWDEKMMRLFPGSHDFIAIKLTNQGIEVRNFDLEKNQAGFAGHPIRISRLKINAYEPEKELEITSIPFPRLRTFIESAKKCKFSVQMLPEHSPTASQTFWQCFDEKKNVYFTLILACDINGEHTEIKNENTEDPELAAFMRMA